MKYIIHNEQFSKKSDITNRCREIVKESEYKDVDKKHYAFILDLFKSHPHYTYKRLYDVKRLFVKRNPQYKTFSLFVELNDGTIDDASYMECIKSIQPNFNTQLLNNR